MSETAEYRMKLQQSTAEREPQEMQEIVQLYTEQRKHGVCRSLREI